MPRRIGYQSQGGWVSEPGSSTPGDNGLPSEISIDNRTNNLPPEYTATSSVELSPGFESGSGDAFLAYISEDDGSGSSGGEGSSSLNGAYRYGFNGKEMDSEIKGTGNQYDYGFRIYDPRIGRFLSVDPLTQKFPFYTPYQFSGNKPIWALDLDGQEDVYYTVNIVINGLGQAKLRSITEDETKAVHWWNNNQTGKLGNGTLFTYRIQTQDMDGKPINLVTKQVFVPKMTFVEKIDNLFMGDESNTENVGYFIFGSGKDMQSKSRIPKASYGSETLDMGGWLDLASGYREGIGARDLAEDFSKSQTFIKTIQKITQIDDAVSEVVPEEEQQSVTNKFVFKRDDNYAGEKKGSIQNHAYVSDTVISHKQSEEKNGVDTFYIRKK